jgi:dihydroneopterin aldolase
MNAITKQEVALLPPAVRKAAGLPVTVLLRDLAVRTTIGVSARERRAPRTLLFDVDIDLPHCRAGTTDRVADTVDYAVVAARIRARLGPDSFRLLERIAECVADLLLDEFGAAKVAVKVCKTGVVKDVALVGVRIERART